MDARSTPAQAHLGIARVPDARVAKLAEMFKPKKITYATIEYVDIGGLQKDREKNSASLVPLREADALAHVVRLFRKSRGAARSRLARRDARYRERRNRTDASTIWSRPRSASSASKKI